MRTIRNFIPYLFLFAVMSLSSCESKEDVNNLTITLNGVVKQEIPVDLYINQYLDYIKDQDLSGKINGSYILSSGSFTVDLSDILQQQEHFSDMEISKLKLVKNITLRNKKKGAFDLSQFNGMKIFVGDKRALLTEATSDDPDELIFIVKDNDLLNYVTKAGKLTYFITTDTEIEITEVDVVELLMDITMDVELSVTL
jgi:hypothetical protein